MRNDKNTSRLRPMRREAVELTDTQIEHLMKIGHLEAEVIDAMLDASRAHDHDRVLELAQALAALADETEQQGKGTQK
jgi:hypothetical protein